MSDQTTPLAALTLTRDEWEQLWVYHHEAQYAAAQKEEYGDAEHHKRRAAAIRSALDVKA